MVDIDSVCIGLGEAHLMHGEAEKFAVGQPVFHLLNDVVEALGGHTDVVHYLQRVEVILLSFSIEQRLELGNPLLPVLHIGKTCSLDR